MATISIKLLGSLSFLVNFLIAWIKKILFHEGMVKLTSHRYEIPINSVGVSTSHSTNNRVVVSKRKSGRKLSYVSSAILDDFGKILSRRERKLIAKQGIRTFTPYYN